MPWTRIIFIEDFYFTNNGYSLHTEFTVGKQRDNEMFHFEFAKLVEFVIVK